MKENEEKSMKIEIYYKGYDLAFSDKLNNFRILNRTYDFSTSKKGYYELVFTIEGKTIKERINI